MEVEEHKASAACYGTTAMSVPEEDNEIYYSTVRNDITATNIPVSANECYDTVADIPLKANESYVPVNRSGTAVTGLATEPLSLQANECYGTVSEMNADYSYADVRGFMKQSHQEEDEDDYI